MIFKSIALSPKSFDKQTRSAEFVCSTEAADRHGSVVRQSWRLERFQQNPIALFAHRSDQPIGRWENMRVEGKQLVGTLRFAEGDDLADRCMNLVGQGVLKAVSVGFLPKTYKFEKHDGDEVVVFEDNELLEVSLVSIPANPEALARELPLSPPAADRKAAPESRAEGPAPADVAFARSMIRHHSDAVVMSTDVISQGKDPTIRSMAESIVASQSSEIEKLSKWLSSVGKSSDGDGMAMSAGPAALERRAVDAEARAARVEGELAEVRQKLLAADTAKAAAEAALAVEKTRADGLDKERKTRKVDALVGKKIDPVDRAFWLEKAFKDEADFDATMARTRDLPTAVGTQVVRSLDPSPPAGSLDPDQAAAKLEELARKRSAETGQPYHLAYGDVQREHQELCT